MMAATDDTDRKSADPAEVTRDIAACLDYVDDIIDRLCHVSVTTPIDRHQPAPGTRGNNPRGADPTWGTVANLDRWLTSRTVRLVGRELTDDAGEVTGEETGIVHDIAILADAVGVDLRETVTDDDPPLTMTQLVNQIRTTGPTSRTWRLRLRQLGTALHGILTDVEHGWRDLYHSRWAVGSDGMSRWDEEVDRHATFVAGWIRQIAGRQLSSDDHAPGDNLRRLARAITPPDRPAQRDLIYCRNHPDRLAKYRKKKLCPACDQAERRQSPPTPRSASAQGTATPDNAPKPPRTTETHLKPGDSWT